MGMTRSSIKKPAPKMEGEASAEYPLTVAEAAERVGMSVHTLRYYEKERLLSSVPRDGNSNHRRYTADDIAALIFIQKMRRTAMPIRELQRYMTLRQQGDATAEARRILLQERRIAVQAQIAELTDTLAIIEYKINLAACIHSDAESGDANNN